MPKPFKNLVKKMSPAARKRVRERTRTEEAVLTSISDEEFAQQQLEAARRTTRKWVREGKGPQARITNRATNIDVVLDTNTDKACLRVIRNFNDGSLALFPPVPDICWLLKQRGLHQEAQCSEPVQGGSLQVGDTVKLNSGGPTMTIHAIGSCDRNSVCIWFDGPTRYEGIFSLKSLRKYA
jgi:uncharacterized protein YodC (DUF2158 family)